MIHVVNVGEKLARFTDAWTPKIVAEVNGVHVKLAKLRGPFVWHAHENEDELFFVIQGVLTMKLRDGDRVVRAGEFIVIPRGVEHCPVADDEVHVMLVEPRSTINTGNVRNERTREHLERI